MGVLHCTPGASSIAVVPSVSFLFHTSWFSRAPSLFNYGDPSVTLLPSQFTSLSKYSFMHRLWPSVQTCNWFHCVQCICCHWFDQPQYVKINGALRSPVDNVLGLFIQLRSEQIQRKSILKIHSRPICDNCAFFKAAVIHNFIFMMAQAI